MAASPIPAPRSKIQLPVPALDRNGDSTAAEKPSHDSGDCEIVEDSAIEIEPLNDAMRAGISSLGESSLSSFLSVLFEDDETNQREISIVPDNPKPEQHSVRELHHSFTEFSRESIKPKCRWDYIARDNSDRYLMAHEREREKLQVRSSSFSGKLPSTKRGLRTSNSFSLGRSNSTTSMFLQMPQRKQSPTGRSTNGRKKSIKEKIDHRFNSSLSGLELPLPSRTRGRSSGREPGRSGRAGNDDPGTGNASWGNEDAMERRRRATNLFLDKMMESEGDVSTGTTTTMSISMSSFESDRELSESFNSLGFSHNGMREQEQKQQQSSMSMPRRPSRRSRSPPAKPSRKSNAPPGKPSRYSKSPNIPTRRLESPPPDNLLANKASDLE